MNDYIRRNLESGQRCRQWFTDYAVLITPGSIFETKTVAMTVKVGEIEALAGEQEAAESEGLSATDVKGSERQDLLDTLEPVRDAARAAEFDIPGTRDRYRYDTSMADQQLLAAGRSFAIGGAADQALLESYDAPVKWPLAVTAACDAFEATFAPQISAKGDSVAKNAELYAKTAEMNALKSAIRHSVKIHTATNPGARAAWATAAHVEKAPEKRNPPMP